MKKGKEEKSREAKEKKGKNQKSSTHNKNDQKPNQADPLQEKENTNKIITACEDQNDHNKNQYCQSKNTRKTCRK